MQQRAGKMTFTSLPRTKNYTTGFAVHAAERKEKKRGREAVDAPSG
jgi:hypothetical protein